jgi:nucleolar GTP-binding protein
MPAYNFKSMQVVPPAKDFIDIVLSKTQRQTPTVVHNGWQIQRIRQFYMRKVKFTAQNWNEKLTQILDDFPKVEDIHPFYSDLLNVLYDKDHYKLALGQLSTARNLIDKLSQGECCCCQPCCRCSAWLLPPSCSAHLFAWPCLL